MQRSDALLVGPKSSISPQLPMDLSALLRIRDFAWLYAALPLVGIAGLAFTLRLKGLQWRALPKAIRDLRSGSGKAAAGSLFGPIAVVGAVAVVGAGTAVSLGGAAVLPYVWLFAMLLAPLRFAEVLLAGTDAPGKGDATQSGSLSRRLLRSDGPMRYLGMLLLIATLVAGALWGGAAQGEALVDAARELLPGQEAALLGGAAVVGIALALSGEKFWGIGAAFAVVGLGVLFVLLVGTVAMNPGQAFGALGKAFQLSGAHRLDDWGGAQGQEIFEAAAIYALVPAALGLGLVGAVSNIGDAPVATKASSALLGPLVYAAMATLFVMASVGSGAFSTPRTGIRALPEVAVLRTSIQNVSERLDEERYHDGYMSLMEGQPRSPNLSFATDRGMIADPEWAFAGQSADVRVQIEDGKAFRMLVPSAPEVSERSGLIAERRLEEVPSHRLWEIEVQGQMLPRGGALAIASAPTPLLGRLLLGALLALAAIAIAAWGRALTQSVPANLPSAAQKAAAVLPGAGVVAVAAGVPYLGLIGSIAGAVLVALASLALLGHLGEIQKRAS